MNIQLYRRVVLGTWAALWLLISFSGPCWADTDQAKRQFSRGMVNFVTSPLDVPWDTGKQVAKSNPLNPLSPPLAALWGVTLGSWNFTVRFMVGGFDVITVPFAFLPDYIPPEPFPYVWEEKPQKEEAPAQPEEGEPAQAQEEEVTSPPSDDIAPSQED